MPSLTSGPYRTGRFFVASKVCGGGVSNVSANHDIAFGVTTKTLKIQIQTEETDE